MKWSLIRFVLVVGLCLTATCGSARAATSIINLTCTNRTALLAEGWDFLGRTAAGTMRDTETSVGSTPPDVGYASTNEALGTVLRIPVGSGNLWQSDNTSRNSLFRELSPDWISVRLQLSFAPTQPYQQANLTLYQDDDNYLQVGFVCGYPANPMIAFSREVNGAPAILNSTALNATNLFLRLDRDLTYGLVTAFYSVDGTNWATLGQADQDLVAPRLAIWTGGSLDGITDADLRQLEVVTSATPVVTTLGFQRPTVFFNTIEGQACTNLQKVLVVRRGPAALSWTLTNTAAWLQPSATTGKTPAGFDLGVDVAGLAAGVYETVVRFGAPGAANDPAELNVKLIVNPVARAQASTWRDGKRGAMSVWIDDSMSSMFEVLTGNGYIGSYMLWGVDGFHSIGPFFTNYYQAGMELGGHTVHHTCHMPDELTLRTELESNLTCIVTFTPVPPAEVLCFAYPCGMAGLRPQSVVQQAAAADYYLTTRGYNVNLLEDASPYDWTYLKSFNSHEHDPSGYNPTAPPNPADLKTVVDAAIEQGKWANLVFHGFDNDDGAVAYSVGKDIWVAPAGVVTKYALLRDRTVISNYVESAGQIRFECYRYGLDASAWRSFEAAVTTNDVVTLQVDITGVGSVSNLTVNGEARTNYATREVAGRTMLYLDLVVTQSPQTLVLTVPAATNHAPVLGAIVGPVIAEGQTLTITNTASDPEGHDLSFSLGAGAPVGMTLTAAGLLSWTPGEVQGPGNYPVTVVVRDDGLPPLSATNSFTVTVLEAPLLHSLLYQGNEFSVSLYARSGRRYFLECKTNLSDDQWIIVTSALGDNTSQRLVDPNANPPQFFYRVRAEILEN